MTMENKFPHGKKGGHDRPLHFWEYTRVGRAILVREMNLNDDGVLDEILTDIMLESEAGTIQTPIRYDYEGLRTRSDGSPRPKRARKWFNQIYPSFLKPVFLGAYFMNGTCIGWISLVRAFSIPGQVQVGIIIKPEYRNKGLGTALVMHVHKFLYEITGDVEIRQISMTTRESNERIISIAFRMGMELEQVHSSENEDMDYFIFATKVK